MTLIISLKPLELMTIFIILFFLVEVIYYFLTKEERDVKILLLKAETNYYLSKINEK
ncbi:MAG: hypothetical protein Q7R52_02925 [archaeon]|nr:hypothetical protein [archaeon]